MRCGDVQSTVTRRYDLFCGCCASSLTPADNRLRNISSYHKYVYVSPYWINIIFIWNAETPRIQWELRPFRHVPKLRLWIILSIINWGKTQKYFDDCLIIFLSICIYNVSVICSLCIVILVIYLSINERYFSAKINVEQRVELGQNHAVKCKMNRYKRVRVGKREAFLPDINPDA